MAQRESEEVPQLLQLYIPGPKGGCDTIHRSLQDNLAVVTQDGVLVMRLGHVPNAGLALPCNTAGLTNAAASAAALITPLAGEAPSPTVPSPGLSSLAANNAFFVAAECGALVPDPKLPLVRQAAWSHDGRLAILTASAQVLVYALEPACGRASGRLALLASPSDALVAYITQHVDQPPVDNRRKMSKDRSVRPEQLRLNHLPLVTPTCLAWSPSGSRLAACTLSCAVVVWDADGASTSAYLVSNVLSLNPSAAHPEPPVRLVWTTDQCLILALSTGVVYAMAVSTTDASPSHVIARLDTSWHSPPAFMRAAPSLATAGNPQLSCPVFLCSHDAAVLWDVASNTVERYDALSASLQRSNALVVGVCVLADMSVVLVDNSGSISWYVSPSQLLVVESAPASATGLAVSSNALLAFVTTQRGVHIMPRPLRIAASWRPQATPSRHIWDVAVYHVLHQRTPVQPSTPTLRLHHQLLGGTDSGVTQLIQQKDKLALHDWLCAAVLHCSPGLLADLADEQGPRARSLRAIAGYLTSGDDGAMLSNQAAAAALNVVHQLDRVPEFPCSTLCDEPVAYPQSLCNTCARTLLWCQRTLEPLPFMSDSGLVFCRYCQTMATDHRFDFLPDSTAAQFDRSVADDGDDTLLGPECPFCRVIMDPM